MKVFHLFSTKKRPAFIPAIFILELSKQPDKEQIYIHISPYKENNLALIHISYSDDIYLDGNVHFIGTQGVGKSTILRAILFFYNADTQRLGISVEKQNYTDYYFPYSNSS